MEKTFSKKEALQFGWQQTKKHFVVLAGSVVGVTIIMTVVNFAQETATKHEYLVLALLIGLFGVLLQMIIGMGMIRLALHYAKNETVSIKEAFYPTKHLGHYIAGSLFYLGIVIIGFVLFIIPGVIWGLRYQFFPYLVVEKEMGAREALRKSRAISKGHTWSLFVLAIVVLFMNIIGGITIVGFIITVPVSFMAMVYVYRKLLDANENSSTPPASIDVQKVELTAASLESNQI